MAGQKHDAYGKRLVSAAAGNDYCADGSSVEVDYRNGKARVDGTVGNVVAVEIESRVAKQVRGAVLDLICHPYPKKLLILLAVHMKNPNQTADQCRFILERFVGRDDFRVLVLRDTTCESPPFDSHVDLIRRALADLGWRP